MSNFVHYICYIKSNQLKINNQMALSIKALEEIRTDSNLRAKLMLVDGKSEYTVKRWIEDTENDELTKPKYTNVIAAHTGMTLQEILTEQVPA